MQMDHKQVMRALPHSYPFLLVDKVTECIPGECIVAVKNVTFNEPFFVGHFPGNPIMPGVLIVEALAQASMLCVVCDADGESTGDTSVLFMSIDSARFRKVVVPGDVLVLKSSVCHRRGNSCRFDCRAYVEDVLVTEAQILAMMNK
ncbi:3-hydroxyacyl-ACP dehydratase FabZ [Anaplasma phagocytophilum]|uniref:3-hydroxyacyl-[acyl-carrier-protein] dehydratase FabZ n=8 Tax=Anaplasma phagocytophilum TaxID=948 RepID=FABZ_ANAPZ|nr:3-hydroxyacyl-ACP dehydratase FabZ [Anaplasma phagocytophilum]Q2GIR2.1 RecName: Full=3-hydroxyacyl-[acyl-carrier-protein] dehydratase FabZ; AltName: Full=(3R)-hydroxymyristoyl-[acyl-carrier-protein] dehydratase; Short=(3R)-hydroxymyristoyl-ACP dehydrase; AltName: Full=Beta-hydroxyacyl-ACP dehydratase [Anaplasma phagocytophilum str. HZ]ABD43791.1 beta-hydroxyacyl-(acyl-carrier-protein) dehydratase FabZ [Anaplasma phagocytophilum str. HZ]ANC34895.1 3-hydroxyacyl-[acyl-carrier-protein] dehydrata